MEWANYWSMSPSEKRWFEENHIPLHTVSDIAQKTLDTPSLFIKSEFYEPYNGSLALEWLRSPLEQASAHERVRNSRDHFVRISDSMVQGMWRDSFGFSMHMRDCYGATSEKARQGLNDIFGLYGRQISSEYGLLPNRVTVPLCCETTFGLGITWLFAHETAHLLQNHGAIRAAAEGEGDGLDICEFWLHGTQKELTPHGSWVSHVTELAADYEGILITIQMMSVQKTVGHAKGVYREASLTEQDLWLMSASLTLMFLRFWYQSPTPFSKIATRQHPHPAIRHHMATRAFLSNLNHPEIRKLVGLSLSFKDMERVFFDAFVSATYYWCTRHVDHQIILREFMDIAVLSHQNQLDYLHKASQVWETVREQAKANHPAGDDSYILQFDSDLMDRIYKRGIYLDNG